MFSDTFSTALAAIGLGTGLLVVALAALRVLTLRTPFAYVASPVSVPVEPDAESGVLVAQAGGRVLFVNERAREFFGLDGAAANPVNMARQVRPSDTFLQLFAEAGTARLMLGERQVEATSVRLPAEQGQPPRLILMIKETGRLPQLAADERTTQTLSVISELSRAISSSLDLPSTLDAILNNVGRLFQYDSAELTLWDPAAQTLRPAHLVGNREYERLVRRNPDFAYRPEDSLSGWIAARRAPLILGDLTTFTLARPKIQSPDFPFRAYAGIPLLVGQQLIGTLELISFRVNAYKLSDLPLLTAIAGQAAIALQNSQLYAEQERRLAELSGVAEVLRGVDVSAEPREFYGQLVEDMARLLRVQMVGFLMYAEGARALVAQPPFRGVPDLVVDAYRIPLPAGSALERLWQEAPYWLSNALDREPLLEVAGLGALAQTAGVRSTLIVPIILGARRLGVVQASNRLDGAPFTDADVRLVTVFAGQVAALLENARLVREAQTRAQQAEGLRAIAATAAGSDLDASLRKAMEQAAALLRFEIGLISLLDEARGELIPHPASIFGEGRAEIAAVRLRTDDPFFDFSVTRTRRPFLTQRAQRDRRIAGPYRPIVEKYRVNSVMDVPLVVGERSLGELIVASRREHAFTRADLQLLATIAAQLASAVDRARLSAATDQNLQRRVDQLTALTRVGREINQTLQLEQILTLVRGEVVRATRADDATIALLDLEAAPPYPVALRIGASAGADEVEPLTATEREAARTGRTQRLAGPPAGLVVPIITQETVVGLIRLGSQTLSLFDAEAEEAAGALAAQTAIAVANAQRYADQIRRTELLRRRADQMAQLFEVSRVVRSDKPLAENLETIAFGLQEAIGYNVVSVHTLDTLTRRVRRVVAVGLPLNIVEESRNVEQPWENIQRLFREEFRLSQSYFLPYERAADVTSAVHTTAMPSPQRLPEARADAWHPDDMLVVPLLGSGQEPVGLLSVDDPRDGLRPSRPTIEVIEIFANQAALAIENARLFQAAERRAARLLALHRVIERTATLPDRGQLLQTAAEALLAEMSVDVCLIALRERDQVVVRGRAGAIRPELKLESLLRQLNPLGHVIDQQYPLFSTNVRRSDWATSPFVLLLNVTSFLCAPIFSQGEAIGALFVGSQQAANPFASEDLELFTILTNQLGAALESQRLEGDIRRRAAQLAALAEASRSMTSALRPDDVVHAVMTSLPEIGAYDSATLWLRGAGERRDSDELRIVAARGFENDAERLGLTVNIADSALFAEMARTGGAIVVPDVRADPRFPGGEFQPTRSWLGAPLVSKGRIIGALVLDKIEAAFYSPLTAQGLSAFANQAAVALDNARLFEENEQRRREVDARSQRLALLNRVAAQLSTTLDVESMFETLAREVTTALNVDRAALFSLEDDVLRLALSLPEAAPLPALPEEAVARLRETLAPLAVETVAQEPLLAAERDLLAEQGVQSLLILPLVAARALVGVLLLQQTSARRRFTPGEIELAQTLTSQAAVAVQNARLFAEVQVRAVELAQRNERMAAFNLLARTLSATLDADLIIQEAVEQVAEMFGADHASLILVDDTSETGAVEAEHPPLGLLGAKLTLSTDPLAHQVLARRVVIVNDVASDPRLSDDLRARLAAIGVRALLLAPFVAQGRAFGAYSLGAFTPREFSSDEIELSQTTAAQIASALSNAQAARDLEARVAQRTKELQRERERVETLLQITTELSSSLDLDRVLARALQLVTEAVNATQGSIFVIDLQTDQLMYRAALGSPKLVPPGGEPVPFRRGEGLVGWVIKQRQPVVIHNLDADTRWKKIPGQNTTHKSALAVPLMANEDVLGAMLLFSPLYNAFDEDQLRLVAAAANQVGAASNNAELYRLIRDQAERLGNLLRAQQVETTKNRAILEGITDGVLVADADGQIILFNSACERILGLRREEVLGRPIGEFVGIYGPAGRAWIEAITQWSLDPGTYTPGEAFSQRLELEDQRILAVSLAPVLTGEEYLGSVSLIRDITRDVEVDRLKSEFVTMVSHELRTPITPIKGYADMLLMGAGGPISPMQTKFVEVIKNNADRLSLLVNDLLDISRIESGKVEVALQPLNLREILSSVLDNLRGRSDEEHKPMTLQAELPDELPLAQGDYNRVTQVIMNLAENAFNYTPPGGAISLRAGVGAEGREVVVEVSDNGVGIPPEIQARLFDRFFRGENALVMATAGTGLGLSIAKQLIEMQGGRVWLKHSAPGQGTTFAVALPVAVQAELDR